MTADELFELANARRKTTGCSKCSALVCKGWESLPGGFDRSDLRRFGTLRDPDVEDPTIDEYHPTGTNSWSNDAPIALGWFPYNRCEVWECVGCGKPFLRYTEFGGYYTDERIREIQGDLIHRPGA